VREADPDADDGWWLEMLGRASVGLRLVVVVLLVYVTTAGGSLATTDAVVTYDVTKSLVSRGSLALSGNLLGMDAHRGPDGRYYSPFGIAQSLFNIPFYIAGRSAERLIGAKVGKPDTITKAAVAMGNTVAAAGCVWMTFLLAGCTTLGRRGAVTAALLVAFATVLWPYSKFGFNAPLSGLCLTGAVYGLCVGTRRNRRASLIGAGTALGAALLTRHELALAVLPATAFMVLELRHDRARLVRGLALVWAPLACAVGIWLTLNYVRFGNPFDSGYLRDPIPGFRSPILAGLYGLLFSPSTSLFIYSPIVLASLPALVAFAKRDRHLAWFCGSLVLVFVVFYACLGNWAGGRSYGSRYLVPVLPFLCLPVATLLEFGIARPVRTAVAALAIASAVIQVPGVLVDFSRVSQRWAVTDLPRQVDDRRLAWSASPLVLNTREMVAAVPRNLLYLAGRDTPPAVDRSSDDAGRRDFAQQFWFSLDLWWLYLFHLGACPAWVALALGLMPLGLASWVARGLCADLKRGGTT
jgi:hypothetical protein